MIRSFGISKLDVTKIPPTRLKSLARTALTVRAQAISRMTETRRIATLVAFIHVMEAIATDDALDILELLVKDLLASSEREGKKERLRTLDFESNLAGKPILTAWRFLASIEGRIKPNMAEAPLEVVSKSWVRWVIDSDAQIDRRAYTFCILEQLVEALRRRILTQLNRGETRHSLARALFYGRRGELRQAYRQGQEEQLGALGLVVNLLVLWNTYYMDAALDYLRAKGETVKEEDIARLSPLGHEHINMLGRYHFHLPESLKNGAMRPLRSHPSLETWAETLF